MKRRLITIGIVAVLFIVICATLFNNFKQDNELARVRVAEVTHSLFYAPQYVAISEGFFEEYGIDIDLTLASGADKVIAAVTVFSDEVIAVFAATLTLEPIVILDASNCAEGLLPS